MIYVHKTSIFIEYLCIYVDILQTLIWFQILKSCHVLNFIFMLLFVIEFNITEAEEKIGYKHDTVLQIFKHIIKYSKLVKY